MSRDTSHAVAMMTDVVGMSFKTTGLGGNAIVQDSRLKAHNPELTSPLSPRSNPWGQSGVVGLLSQPTEISRVTLVRTVYSHSLRDERKPVPRKTSFYKVTPITRVEGVPLKKNAFATNPSKQIFRPRPPGVHQMNRHMRNRTF